MNNKLMDAWSNGNRTDVVREIMEYNNSHTAAINFYSELYNQFGKDQAFMFLGLVESWEEKLYFGESSYIDPEEW